jgi:hypothetical protein
MKNFTLFALLFISIQSFAQLNGPESIEYDVTNNRYLIANSANGKIMQRDASGNISTFVSGVSPNPYGIEIVGNTVYACCGGKVIGYDLTTATEVFNLNLSASFLNGITHDIYGNLYVTDFNGLKIYRINIANQSFNVFAGSLVNKPNGIIYNPTNNSLVFVSWGSSAKIKSCSLADSSVTTLLTTTYSNIDGIARKDNGDYYISVWGTSSVYKYNFDFSSPATLVTSGLSSPADIYYNNLTDTLAIPNSGNNSITFISQGNSISLAACADVPLTANADSIFFTEDIFSSSDSVLSILLTNNSGAGYGFPLANFKFIDPLPAGTSPTLSSQGFEVFASAWNAGESAKANCYLNVTQPIPANYTVKFQVFVTNISPSDIDTCFFVDTFQVNLNPQTGTGLVNIETSSFNLSPNPAQEIVYLKSNSNSLKYYFITDVTGRTINNISEINSSDERINISELNKGFYFISVLDSEKRILSRKKFIKD